MNCPCKLITLLALLLAANVCSASENVRSYLRGPIPDSEFPFRRIVFQGDISMKSIPIKVESKQNLYLVIAAPRQPQRVPVVLILDTECTAISQYSNPYGRDLTAEQLKIAVQSTYALNAPFGSNLLGSGFAIAYLATDDNQFDALRAARSKDWQRILKKLRAESQISSDDIFLFSTREFANLACYLASQGGFAGFILEEPGYLLFTSQIHEDLIADSYRLTPDEIWSRTGPELENRYTKIFREIRCPIVLIRPQAAPYHDLNQKTLLRKLTESGAYVESIYLDTQTRRLESPGEQNGMLQQNPTIRYNLRSLRIWLAEMTGFLTHTTTLPVFPIKEDASQNDYEFAQSDRRSVNRGKD